ncbi:MAG: hypothetical protein GEU82_00270 [Luteitalea sp.]|nr:hypothetical protein [Luteitalea sp.]
MRSIILSLFLALSVAASPRATVLIPADVGELARDARAIARGVVVSVDGRWTDDRRTIETIVTLETEAYLKGGFGETLQFRIPGGSLGRYRNIVVGAPQFTPGQRVIVFLGARGPGIPFVLGLGQGVFRVTMDASRTWTVSPPPMLPSSGPVVRGSATRRAAPLADFEREVRALAAGAR